MPTKVSAGQHEALCWLVEQVDAELLVQASPVSGVGGGELVDDRADPSDQVADLVEDSTRRRAIRGRIPRRRR
jgi:hypothetical protein